MGLFEHLFKSRPDDSVERVVEAPLKASLKGPRLIEMREVGAEEPPPPDPAEAFLHPKGYAPGTHEPSGPNPGFVPVLPSAKRAPLTERRPLIAAAGNSSAEYLVLTVGDVLSRIPAHFLRPGPHDLKRELRFQIADLSSDITRGRPMIALSCIAGQCPEVFQRPISDAEDMAIRLPLQKLFEQIAVLHSRPVGASPLVPARPPAAVAPRSERPEEPVAPPPIPALVVAEESIPAPLAPVAETVVPTAPPPVPVPEHSVVIEPPVSRDRPPEPESALPLAAPGANGESMIHLSLGAIVAKLPAELLAGPAPRLADSYRISLPFPMIERQLGSGAVSISGVLFASLVPPLLRHHFCLRDGIAVPIPLEEIFQNLPVDEVAEAPRAAPDEAISPAPGELESPVVGEPGAELEREIASPAAEPISVPPPGPVDAPHPPVFPPPPLAVTPEVPRVLAATVAPEMAPPSPASAMPDGRHPAAVHLQPFRNFVPPSPTVEQEKVGAATNGEMVILGEHPAAPPPDPEAASDLPPAGDGEATAIDLATAPGVETAQESGVLPPSAPTPLCDEPSGGESPRFKVLPTPENQPGPATAPPAPDPLEAFTPDQPPPLIIEVPAAAVAVLRATVPGPQEAPVFAAATTSVQPPKIFRPVVLAPPIAGFTAVPPVNLAPTLTGSTAASTGMISLAPGAETIRPTPPPLVTTPPAPPREPSAEAAPAPPAEAEPKLAGPRESAPTLKNFVRQIFQFPPANPEPKIPAAASPPLAVPTPQPTFPAEAAASASGTPDAAPFQFHLPPLPHPVETTSAPEPAPPALPLSRFDQHSLQSLFMTEEALDLPRVCRLAAALPGIQACVISTHGKTFVGGTLPEGFDLGTLRGLSPQVGAAADRLPIGLLKNFTLYGEQYSISFFERSTACLCAIHRARSFVPGVREKLAAVVDEIARG